MKRIALFALIAVVIATFFGIWLSQHIKRRHIAMTLLEMHHQWATNDYHAKGMTVPRFLAEQGRVRGYSSGILGAYVEYYSKKSDTNIATFLFGISRANTNTTTWTLEEVGYTPGSPTNLPKIAWKHKLMTVRGEP
jgi:hypothetical protein